MVNGKDPEKLLFGGVSTTFRGKFIRFGESAAGEVFDRSSGRGSCCRAAIALASRGVEGGKRVSFGELNDGDVARRVFMGHPGLALSPAYIPSEYCLQAREKATDLQRHIAKRLKPVVVGLPPDEK